MTKFTKLKNYFVALLMVFAVSFIAAPVFAAELFFEPENQEINIGERFETSLFLNTKGEYINAVEGKIIFPGDLLELKEIRDGNSIVNFWIERPRSGSNDEVIFSGITPGGYMGEKGLFFSIIFKTKGEGEGTVEVRQAKALLNDGKGTPAELKISNFQFLISKQIPISQTTIAEIRDSILPESFEPIIGQDAEIFDGKWFLVFATQDKGAGIDYYEVLEKGQKSSIRGLIEKNEWQIAESPYLLKDQELKSQIFVKAVDKAGNERIVEVEARHPIKWYENWLVWGIIILGIMIICLIWRILRRRTRN